MEEQKRDEKLNTEAPVPSTSAETPATLTPEARSPERDQTILETGPPPEARGRMIKAGLVATVILSGIAVLVAGVFQITARWLMPCPTDLPVNDPALILWNAVISDRVSPAPLGVARGLAREVQFKVHPSETR